MNTPDPFKTVLGNCKGTPRQRIWIEGKRLLQSGFTREARYQRVVTPERIVITLVADGRYKVSGKHDKPIIDITGAYVAQTFPTGTHVSVLYGQGTITITPADA